MIITSSYRLIQAYPDVFHGKSSQSHIQIITNKTLNLKPFVCTLKQDMFPDSNHTFYVNVFCELLQIRHACFRDYKLLLLIRGNR